MLQRHHLAVFFTCSSIDDNQGPTASNRNELPWPLTTPAATSRIQTKAIRIVVACPSLRMFLGYL